MTEISKIEVDINWLNKHPWVIVVGVSLVLIVLALAAGTIIWLPVALAGQTTATLTPTATILPTLTPTPLPTTGIPTPTPTPEPTTEERVFTTGSNSVYLRAKPAGTILLSIPNGERVEDLGNRSVMGGSDWVEVHYQGQTGWIGENFLAHFEAPPPAFIIGEGANLRTQPGSSVLGYLFPGTPLSMLGEIVDYDGITWQAVTLPDAKQGWVAQFLLSTENP